MQHLDTVVSRPRSRSHSPRRGGRMPLRLTPKSVKRVFRLQEYSDNVHGIMTADHQDALWPLPVMFGFETYAYSLIDIPSEKYEEEVVVLSRKLIRLFYDQQIIDHEWRKTYKLLLEAEKRKDSMTPGVLEKSRQKADADVISIREQLLRLQDQRDLFAFVISQIFERCKQIKQTIQKEHELEALRQEMNNVVQSRYPPDDQFWKAKFKIRIPSSNGSKPSHGSTKVK